MIYETRSVVAVVGTAKTDLLDQVLGIVRHPAIADFFPQHRDPFKNRAVRLTVGEGFGNKVGQLIHVLDRCAPHVGFGQQVDIATGDAVIRLSV